MLDLSISQLYPASDTGVLSAARNPDWLASNIRHLSDRTGSIKQWSRVMPGFSTYQPLAAEGTLTAAVRKTVFYIVKL
jgi:hypothetical protein